MSPATVLAAVALILYTLAVTCEGRRVAQATSPFDVDLAKTRAEAFRHARQFGKSMKNLATPTRRQMRPMQTSTLCTTAPAVKFVQDFTACENAAGSLDQTVSSLAQADTVMASFCSSACVNFINSADTQYLSCLTSEASEFFRVSKFVCTKRDNAFCGASLLAVNVLAPDCDEAATQPGCIAKGSQCAWNGDLNGGFGSCQQLFSAAGLNGICSSCLNDFVESFPTGGTFGKTLVSSIALLQNTVCSRASGVYCYPEVQDIINTGVIGEYSGASVEGLCASPTKLVCLGKILQGSLAYLKYQADTEFITCVFRVQNKTSVVNAECRPPLDALYQGFESTTMLVGRMCLKNANGRFCSAQQTTPAIDDCFGLAVANNQCNATCDTVLSSFVNDLGCCLGTIQEQVFAIGAAPSTWYPSYTQVGTAAPSTASPISAAEGSGYPAAGTVTLAAGEVAITNVARGGLEGLGACASLRATIRTSLAKGCAPAATSTAARSLSLRVLFSKIDADAALKQRFIAALTTDVASAIGVSSSQIKNGNIVEDSTVTVTIATTSSRRQTSASTAGCKFTFDIEGQTSAVTSAAADNLDTAASSGSLQLLQASAVASTECDGCTSSEGSFVVGSSTSSAAMVAALNAVLLLVVVIFA